MACSQSGADHAGRQRAEPDLAVVRGDDEDYDSNHPGAADVELVIEVADSSLTNDRLKSRVYAAAGIPEYWIVNLVRGEVEVYSLPTPDARAYAPPNVVSGDTPLRFTLDIVVDLGASFRELLPASSE